MKKHFTFLLLILFLLFLSSNFCYALTRHVYTYSCIPGCGGGIQFQKCTTTYSCGEDADSKTTCEDPVVKARALPWQVCVGGPQVYATGRTCPPDSEIYHEWERHLKFYYVCSGACLSNVDDVRYYSNPNYPQKPELTINGSKHPETCKDKDLEGYPLEKNCIEPSNDSNNVKLPLKIDWDEDTYWMERSPQPRQWADDLKSISEYERKILGPQSYKLKLELKPDWVSSPTSADSETFSDYISKNFKIDEQEIKQGYFEKVLNLDTQPKYIKEGSYRSSEYNFRVDHNPCWLKSGNQKDGYNLTIQTCCNPDGTDCNEGGLFNFKTSYAPELKSPEDLDWEGAGFNTWNAWSKLPANYKYNKSLNLNDFYNPFNWETTSNKIYGKETPPVVLDWCEIKKKTPFPVISYEFLLNVFQQNEETGKLEALCPVNKRDGNACRGTRVIDLLNPSFYNDSDNMQFTKNQSFSWKTKACSSNLGVCNSPYSQTWNIATTEANLGEVGNISPQDNAYVGIPTYFNWIPPYGYIFSYFELYKNNVKILETNQKGFGSVATDLDINTKYQWRFKNCTDEKGKFCDDWSKLYNFTTTGLPPKLIAPIGKIKQSEIEFKWDNVEGADHYIFKIKGPGVDKEITTNYNFVNLKISEDFPVKLDENYNWQVKTCADRDFQKCGEFSLVQSFKEVLNIPQNTNPDNKAFTIYKTKNLELKWDPVVGAETYEVSIKYNNTNEESNPSCENNIEKEIFKHPSKNLVLFDPGCLGTYSWKVRACISKKAKDNFCTKWGNSNLVAFYQDIAPENMTAGSAPSEKDYERAQGGIVACGRDFDNPETEWDETEDCTPKHLILLLRNIIDFMLWRFIPALLVILMLYTGALYIFTGVLNGEVPNYNQLIENTKKMWKYVGLGFLILFFAWFAMDFVLNFLGFKVGVFKLINLN